MGVENTWTATSAPMGMHTTPPGSETLSLFATNYQSRRSNSPTSPVLNETTSQAYAESWDDKLLPETPPSPNDLGHFGDQPSLGTELVPFYPANQDPQDEDIKDPYAALGVCGLRNLGNTCFMSAGIQCLSNTPTLLHFFVLGSQIEKCPSDSLTAQFALLLQRLWSGQIRVVYPAHFKYALGSTYPQFKDYRQHDCQEFLALLLDSLHEQLNAAGACRSSFSKVEVKSPTSCSTSVHPMPPCTPPKIPREKNELALKTNSVTTSPHLQVPHILQDILKDSKTSNVNVLIKEEEPNNKMKFDSDKYPRHELPTKHKDIHPKHNLVGTYDFDNKSVSTKRIKETNLLQDQSADGNKSGDGLDLKRIKLTDQNNCKKSCVQDSDVDESGAYLRLHPNNAVLSYVNGISKHCVNEEPLAREQMDAGQSSKDASTDSTDEPELSKEDLQADEHWEKHLARNKSVVVDSFLGQFKSTVICSECRHISVTHEPFMYLSVPLPHAMERQIGVTFVPALEPTAVQYLLTVNKQDKVRHLREALTALRTSESYVLPADVVVVMAEVLDHHISKILDESVPLRHVDDKRRSIYAFEMLPPPSWCATPGGSRLGTPSEEIQYPYSPQEVYQPAGMFSPVHPFCSSENESGHLFTPTKPACASNGEAQSTYPSKSRPTSPDALLNTSGLNDEKTASDVEMPCVLDSSTNDIPLSNDWPCTPVKQESSCTRSSGYGSEEVSTSMETSQCVDVDVDFREKELSVNTICNRQCLPQTPPDTGADCARTKDIHDYRCETGDLSRGSLSETSSTQSASEISLQVLQKCTVEQKDSDEPEAGARTPDRTPERTPEPAPLEIDGFDNWNGYSMAPRKPKRFDEPNERFNIDKSDDWKCAICLEDNKAVMWKHSNLNCNCLLCEGCIENACKHNNSKNKLQCPTCRRLVEYEQDFVKIGKLGDMKPAVRLLTVPIVFRLDTQGDGNNNKKTYNLFGHPNVIRLPNTLPAKELASAVRRLVHTDQPYSVLIVNGVGDGCSRCMYNEHCRGCPVPTEGEVSLCSGDNLAIRFTETVAYTTIEHKSLKQRRHAENESLSLYDCLKAFSESELLDEYNPWFCPKCQKNQCATKTLSVCRYPDLLIVYLKRFVFHNGFSTKLDNKVAYPLNGLIINPQSSHRREQIVYNMYACVCHVGGVSAGHYTAYAKNPCNSEWYHFNDENVTRQRPQEEDYSNAYILFYQKQGAVLPKINFQESVKTNINQIIDDLGSTMDSDAVRTKTVIDSEVAGDDTAIAD